MNKNLTVDKLPLVKVVKKSKKETNKQREEYLMKILLKVECNEFLYYALGTYNLNKRQLAINKYNKTVDKVNDIVTEISSLYDKSILMFFFSKSIDIEINFSETPLFIEKRKMSPKKTAIKRFAKIPAPATAIVPNFLFIRLFGLYGTGFAQPNKNGEWVKTRNAGKIIEPKISKCLSGFKVSLPAYKAVLSPKRNATKPWETSWITTDIISMATKNTASIPCIMINLMIT